MPRTLARLSALAAWLSLFAPAAAAQEASAVPPSPEAFLGYPLGAHFTPYHAVQAYARALAEASPLVEYRPYGTTPERRELFQLVIARPEYRQRMEEILAANAELTRPETPAERARGIATTIPAIVYFSYGVHGNESSSSEAAMWTAYDLASGAASVAGVLDSVIVVIDPVTNPDGRDRYVQWYRSVVGEAPNADPDTREHQEPWPGGRYNHYLFDLNRDWAWMTQPETRARLATWDRWNPEVHVDFHEMGYNSSYFFFPAADPINEIYPPYVLDWHRRIGVGNARAFDAHGWPYFTGDNYDFFYPGYGDTWPGLNGAIGMTYEQAGGGSAGLAVEQASGDTLTLRDRALHHWTSGEATLRTVAAGKTQLLLDRAASQRVIGQGEPDVLLVAGPDSTRVNALVAQLRRQGIEVERAGRSFPASATAYPGFEPRSSFPAGTYRVRARQPRGRLATTLLQPQTKLDAQFSYDISAWSLPYAYDVAAYQARSTGDAAWAPVPAPGAAASIAAPPAGYGYLLAPGDSAAAGVVRYLRAGGHARVVSRETTIGGRSWPAGSWFLPARSGDSTEVRATAARLGGLVTPVATGLAQSGVDLGSAYVWPVSLPRVAVLTGEGIVPTSYGAHWYFLEQTLGLPFDPILLQDLPGIDLSEYDVLVLPDAYGGALGDPAKAALERWVQAGGRLVAVADGARAIAPTFDVKVREAPEPDSTATTRFLTTRPERELHEWLQEVPGAILPTRLDAANPLAWGAGGAEDGARYDVLHAGELVFEPAADLETVAYFPADLQATSGVISDEQLQLLENGAWLADKRVGAGSIVLFADDPLFRLFWVGAHPLYANALLIGPRR
jgi:hypothetical protein